MTVRTLGPGSLKIGITATAREWAGNLIKTQLVPSTESDDEVPLLDGSTMSGEDTTTWTLGGTLQQSFDLDSLEIFCLSNAGKELPFVFTPNSTGAVTYSGTVKIRPVQIGGDVKKKNTSDFEFPLTGQPTYGARV